jgi:hypothetical protein
MTLSALAPIAIIAALIVGVASMLRDRAPRRAARVALQFAAAALLYFALFPPGISERFAAGTLVVLTPGATAEQTLAGRIGSATIVALPGVETREQTERVPDLGTALRRHPLTDRLHVVGSGLPPRDVDAVRGLVVDFDPSPTPRGIVALSKPAVVRAGAVFAISGRVEGDANGRVELRDPAGELAASSAVDAAGAFALVAQAKTPGVATFELRALDAAGTPIDTMPLPIAVDDGDGVRVLVLAGGPDAELKYLRRWASDAGVALTSRIALSDGIAMHDGSAPSIDAATLASADLVIADERAWVLLDDKSRAAIADAVRGGLGLLLRVTGPLPDAVAADWQTYGFNVAATTDSVASDDGASATTDAREGAPDVAVSTLQPVSIDASDAVPIPVPRGAAPFAKWRNVGQGRVAVSRLADAYRVSLGGDAGAFGTLWSDVVATLARSRGKKRPDVPDDARVDRRSVVCGIADGAFIEEGDAKPIELIVDAANSPRHCAAFWPSRAGAHVLVSNGRRIPFAVRAASVSAFESAANTAATRALGGTASAAKAESSRSLPGPRWPFFAAWLASVALLWWLERNARRASDAGRPAR